MYESVKAGRIVFEESLDTLSDGTSGGVEENSVTFSSLCVLYSTFWVYKIRSVSGISLRRSLSLFVLIEYVDDWILVDEEEIGKAIIFMLQNHHKVGLLFG